MKKILSGAKAQIHLGTFTARLEVVPFQNALLQPVPNFRRCFLVLLPLLAFFSFALAQQLPPPEPPKPMPGTETSAATLRVTTNEVLVPTLVEKKDGGVLYGLKQSDFVLEDNGVPQKIRVQEEMDTTPVAL